MATEMLKISGNYLGFPFKMARYGSHHVGRAAHVADQITNILLTEPFERVFMPRFGIGVNGLLFAPLTDALAGQIEADLAAQLNAALEGEVLPQSIKVTARGHPSDPDVLRIEIAYSLAAINQNEILAFDRQNGRPHISRDNDEEGI